MGMRGRAIVRFSLVQRLGEESQRLFPGVGRRLCIVALPGGVGESMAGPLVDVDLRILAELAETIDVDLAPTRRYNPELKII